MCISLCHLGRLIIFTLSRKKNGGKVSQKYLYVVKIASVFSAACAAWLTHPMQIYQLIKKKEAKKCTGGTHNNALAMCGRVNGINI